MYLIKPIVRNITFKKKTRIPVLREINRCDDDEYPFVNVYFEK